MAVMGATKFERFFRAAAGLNVDKQDVKRYGDFVNHKIDDLLFVARPRQRRMVATSSIRTICQSLKDCRNASTLSPSSVRKSN
jgi:hypothetical protein